MPKFTAAREQEIRDLLVELARSKLSIAEFARQRGIAAWKLYTWRQKFESPSQTKPIRKRRAARADLVEIAHPTTTAKVIELVIGDITMRVPFGFDADELARLIGAIRPC